MSYSYTIILQQQQRRPVSGHGQDSAHRPRARQGHQGLLRADAARRRGQRRLGHHPVLAALVPAALGLHVRALRLQGAEQQRQANLPRPTSQTNGRGLAQGAIAGAIAGCEQTRLCPQSGGQCACAQCECECARKCGQRGMGKTDLCRSLYIVERMITFICLKTKFSNFQVEFSLVQQCKLWRILV